jgi:Tol biopolymer transport system component
VTSSARFQSLAAVGLALLSPSALRAEPAATPAATTAPTVVSKALAEVVRELAPRNVTSSPDQNEANPRFSPDGRYLSFERRNGAAQALFVVDTDAAAEVAPERVSSQPPRTSAASAEEALLGDSRVDDSFNAQISFYPDARSFVFTGNAGTGVYRIYEGKLGGAVGTGAPRMLSAQSKEDGHPAVSPDGRSLVYVSARGGIGKLILRDVATGFERPLTAGDKIDLYPTWSPDSKSVAYTSGDNDNHDVFVVDIPAAPIAPPARPGAAAATSAPLPAPAPPRQLTSWKYDDLRPTFSPDGKLVAFYSNYSPSGEEKEWSIVTVPADGSGPAKGSALAQRAAAANVVKDPEVGPAWLPAGHALVYARNNKAEWNPIYVVDADTHEEIRIETPTRMNHDLTCSGRGVLAFRAQVASWDDIFLARLVKVTP